MKTFPTRPELEAVVICALENLFKHDDHLFSVDANERSISHCLANYIQEGLPTWDVDCEYNRNGHEPKVTNLPVENTTTDDEHARTVFPDIIVHRRGTRSNLLAVEIKKSTSSISTQRDEQKLESYCRAPLLYKHALLLKLRTDQRQAERRTLKWFPTRPPSCG
jgi:hypothetical protein